MITENNFSQADIKSAQTLMIRGLPDMLSGKSQEDSLRSVLERDEELWLFITSKTPEAQAARDELARSVYNNIRGSA